MIKKFSGMFVRVIKSFAVSLATGLFIGASSLHAAQCKSGLNQIDYAMYFHAEVRDSEECAMSVKNGRIVMGDHLTNAAMTCPDMFSWKLFVEVVQDKWWTNWADEQQNWPEQPYPLCSGSQAPSKAKCCSPDATGNDKEHCPVFPGDSMATLKATDEAMLNPPARALRNGFTSLIHSLAPRLNRLLEKSGETGPEAESIGRIIRQDNSELTVRNRPFHEYLFRNNLYNTEGVVDVYNRNSRNIPTHAPYHPTSTSVGGGQTVAELSVIDLPTTAIMIKSNWIAESLAKKLGIKEDPMWPFIKKMMKNGDKKEIHWLVAFHVSSKDIPNWVWTTFEHVSMPGRCDFTGCNDSYGYTSMDKLPPGVADNYVAPKMQCDDLATASWVFKHDQQYTPEAIRDDLKQVFASLGIGSQKSTNPNEPTMKDTGWLSYRLKGSQVEFTNSMGRDSFLGNSITEAGFMDGSSCITCHARAGSDQYGILKVPPPEGRGVFPLSVFSNTLSDYGYGRSDHGIPNPDWYHDSNQPPSLKVLQTDFVWGFLFARTVNWIKDSSGGEKR
ncbi:MAG: hypothetical protein PVG66_01420 [Chromatiales bacterium]|jgi:hypothetical protein